MTDTEFDALEAIDFSGTVIADTDLEALKPLVCLKKLSLADTQIGNNGLQTLSRLTVLKELDLTSTRATSEAITALRKQLPGCNILFGK